MSRFYSEDVVDSELNKFLVGNCNFCFFKKECDDSGVSKKGSHRLCWALREFPTADVEPVRHAWWIDGKYSLIYPHCSMCGKFSQDGSKTLFCPNCGAKMDGKENDQ